MQDSKFKGLGNSIIRISDFYLSETVDTKNEIPYPSVNLLRSRLYSSYSLEARD